MAKKMNQYEKACAFIEHIKTTIIGRRTYTVKIDMNLPFKDSQIGCVIINDVEYVRKHKSWINPEK